MKAVGRAPPAARRSPPGPGGRRGLGPKDLRRLEKPLSGAGTESATETARHTAPPPEKGPFLLTLDQEKRPRLPAVLNREGGGVI